MYIESYGHYLLIHILSINFKAGFATIVPAMIAQLVNVLYSMVDRMFVGQIPETGGQALAAIGICGAIVTLLSSFGTLVGIGGGIHMSIKMGQEEKEDAKQILYTSFIMLVCLSLCLTVFLFLLKPMIYRFGDSDVLYPYANSYLMIYTVGSFFALMAIAMNYFITCQGYYGIYVQCSYWSANEYYSRCCFYSDFAYAN